MVFNVLLQVSELAEAVSLMLWIVRIPKCAYIARKTRWIDQVHSSFVFSHFWRLRGH